MGTFDAESYLRALGERALLKAYDPSNGNEPDSPIDQPLRALVFTGALDERTAIGVITGYALADAVRDRGRGLRFMAWRVQRARSARGAPAKRPPAPRAFVVDHALEIGGGQLALGELFVGSDSSTLKYRWGNTDLAKRRRHSTMRLRGDFPWGNDRPTIRDNAGNTPTVHSSNGGGNIYEWSGEFELRGALAKELEWLEINGIRVTVKPSSASELNRVEKLDDESPSARFLWRMLAAGEMPFHRPFDVEPVLDALIAAGSLQRGDELCDSVRATAAALPDHPGHFVAMGGRRTARHSSDQIPARWRSLLARLGATDGPVRNLTFGITSPSFDGNRATIAHLSSEESSFSLEVSVAYASGDREAFDHLPVAWWARDDLGNHYLGGPNGWHGSGSSEGGTLLFWPALDPRATRLDVLIEADTERAVLAIDLTTPGDESDLPFSGLPSSGANTMQITTTLLGDIPF